jgi:hypothetical protein
MSREQLFVLVILMCILNGIFSPWVLIAVGFAPAWMPGFVPYGPGTLFYGASLLISTMTLLVSGLPAALAERILRDDIGPVGTLWIWLAGATLMSLPAIEAVIKQL